MRSLDFLCAFLDFFGYPRIKFRYRAFTEEQRDKLRIHTQAPPPSGGGVCFLQLKTLFATILLSSCISSFIEYMGSGLRLGGYRHKRVISVFVCMVRQFSVFYPITTSSSPGKPCHFVGQGLSNSQI